MAASDTGNSNLFLLKYCTLVNPFQDL